ncbi:MAG: DUF5107 domain-containing protein, partial [Chloroflexota bacterium]|nr:DUF5107 domain-containing protein [Chloroflexota bacterium]
MDSTITHSQQPSWGQQARLAHDLPVWPLFILPFMLVLLTACTGNLTLPPITLTQATLTQTLIDSASDAAPIDTVLYYTETVTLPTYPYERYQTDALDARYNWPYKVFDVERFRTEAPSAEDRTYQVIVLENAYLKLLILPQLGGRVWQVIHKPSGAPMFYQNSVVKPTHWGIAEQRGWLALGGLEWALPVVEHGYD